MVGLKQLGGAETSRRGRTTAPRRQEGVGRSLMPRRGRRQSPSAVALFLLSKKGKHVRREAAGLRRPRRVSNATSTRCNMLGSIVLTLDLLRQITNNFSDDQDQLLGEGAFGKVYKGVLPNGDTIAVKRFASTITGLQDAQYENEAQHLMRLEHQNIVQLVGYCSETEMKLVPHNGIFVRAEESERLLCLEYMSKGSLRDHLSDETSGLEWDTRYKIIEGICNGLHYLHEEWQATPIIHMDLKPANILLDDNMVPKIADFGLSRLFGEEQTRTSTTSCKGTRGYMPPEYIEKGVITKMFDIFSLGVIIIEIITGLRDYPTDETENTSQQYIDRVLNNWRHRLTKAQGYTSEDIDYQQIKQSIQIGLLCVKFDREKRPTINQIIKMLERSDEAYQKEKEVPRRPDAVKTTPHETEILPSFLQGFKIYPRLQQIEPPKYHQIQPWAWTSKPSDTLTSPSPSGGGGFFPFLEEMVREQSLLEATRDDLFLGHIDNSFPVFPKEDAPAPGSPLSARIIDVGRAGNALAPPAPPAQHDAFFAAAGPDVFDTEDVVGAHIGSFDVTGMDMARLEWLDLDASIHHEPDMALLEWLDGSIHHDPALPIAMADVQPVGGTHPDQTTKVNADGAFFPNSGSGGWGYAIRDDQGTVWKAGAGSVNYLQGAFHAELLACAAGLKMAREMGIQSVVLETDATMVKVALQTDEYRLSTMSGIITEIKHLIVSDFISVSIVVCPRLCNNLAHELAAFGCKLPGGTATSWADVPPAMEGIVTSDLAGSEE